MNSISYQYTNMTAVHIFKPLDKLLNSDIFYLLFLPLPIVDSLNGMINGGGNEGIFSLGMLYRLLVITCCFVVLFSNIITKKNIHIFLFIIILIILPHIFDLTETSFLSLSIKTLLPILCIEVFRKTSSHLSITNTLEKLINTWALLFPITILIPFFLGIGFQTYGNQDVGYKGFYFAQNDLNFVLSLLFFLICKNLFYHVSIFNITKFSLLGICIILLGMKSGYILMVFSIIYWIICSKMTLFKRLFIVITILAGSLVIFPYLSNSINAVINRWTYFFQTSDSFVSFFSSGRVERIPEAFSFLSTENSNPLWILFGSGTQYSDCLAPFGLVEMDIFDLFFQFGLFGTLFITIYYVNILFYKIPTNYQYLKIALLMSFALSIAAGHVINSALSSMVFAVLCGLIISNKQSI